MYVGGKLDVIKNIITNGTVTAVERINCKTLVANNWDGIGIGQLGSQGAYLSWNRNSGSGRTTFANQQGSGYGGWEWVNYNMAGVQEPAGDPAMQLGREGGLRVRNDLVVGGNLTVTGNISITPQYVALHGTWSGGWSQAGTIHVWRTSKTVTLGFTEQAATAATV